MKNPRYDRIQKSFSFNRSSVSLLIINMSGDQQARRFSDCITQSRAVLTREHACHPSQVHWLHHEPLVPFPLHQAPARVQLPTRLQILLDSWSQGEAMTTRLMRAKLLTIRKYRGRILLVDPFAVCSARSGCLTFPASQSSPFISEVTN